MAQLAAQTSASALTSRTAHATGLAYLTIDRIDDACTALERAAMATTQAPGLAAALKGLEDVTLLSDLAAAYYERGRREERTEAILDSIELASRAHRLDGTSRSAAFNLALGIDAVHTPAQAIRAWEAYLELDGHSGWAEEARARIAALRAEGVRGSAVTVEQNATRLETELMGGWAAAYLSGDGEAARTALQSASAVAKELAFCCNDAFHEAGVNAVSAAVRSDRRLALQLASAHVQYREGRELYARNRTSQAIPLLESSRDSFRAAGDVFATKPWKYLAASHLYLGDTAGALRESNAALDFCAALKECAGSAPSHLLWVRALASGRSGNPQQAIVDYTDALRGFQSARELDNAASVEALLAENLEFLGAGEDAWPHRRVALRAAVLNGTLDRIYVAFSEAATAARSRGHLVSARLFQDVVVDAARHESNTVLLSDALLWRGQAAARLAPADARRDLEEAARLAARIEDPGRRARIAAAAATARAELVAPHEAVESLTSALRYYESVGDHYRLAELYGLRGEAHEKAGLSKLAEGDYLRCIRELESDRAVIADAALRERSFSRTSETFDRLVRYLWTSGRRDEAFQFAEQSRARELTSAIPAALRPSDVRSALRDGEAVVEYAVLADRLVCWVIRPDGVTTLESAIGSASVDDAVAALRDAERSVPAAQALQRIASLVYTPVEPALRGTRRVVLVANKALRAVPFSAMRNETSGRYLIEEHEIVFAPSAAAYLRSVQRDAALARNRSSGLLVVAYVRGDASRGLPALANGRREVDDVRRVYGTVGELTSNAATPERVLSAASGASVIHIVAHAIENREHPQFSSLVLAPGRGGRDLYAQTIASASLHDTRVVVLSSCGTPADTRRNDAPLTIPESFLAAGVPLVIGALRPVDDAKTAAFAVALHRALASSGDPVTALRQAQLDCITSPERRDPEFWSSWIAIGGSS